MNFSTPPTMTWLDWMQRNEVGVIPLLHDGKLTGWLAWHQLTGYVQGRTIPEALNGVRKQLAPSFRTASPINAP